MENNNKSIEIIEKVIGEIFIFDDIKTLNRSKRYVPAKSIYAYILKEKLKLTYQHISDRLGFISHTSARHLYFLCKEALELSKTAKGNKIIKSNQVYSDIVSKYKIIMDILNNNDVYNKERPHTYVAMIDDERSIRMVKFTYKEMLSFVKNNNIDISKVVMVKE